MTRLKTPANQRPTYRTLNLRYRTIPQETAPKVGRKSNPGRFRTVLIRALHCNPAHAKLELPESLSVPASSPRIRNTCELSTPDKLVYVTVAGRERDSIGTLKYSRGGSSKTGKDNPCFYEYRELYGISGNSFPVFNGPRVPRP